MPKAYELLASPSAWTKGVYMRDKDGNPIDVDLFAKIHAPEIPEGCSMCASAATFVAYRFSPEIVRDTARTNLIDILIQNGRPADIAAWNDSPKTTHEEVIRFLKAADV